MLAKKETYGALDMDGSSLQVTFESDDYGLNDAFEKSVVHLLKKSTKFTKAEIQRWYLAFGRYLKEIHVTWAHLKKKQTRLRTNTKTLEDLCSQSLETASPTLHDAVTTFHDGIDTHRLTRRSRRFYS
ncbi:ribonuclease H-like domain-containing protein [Tanacetum coccineum]